MKQATILAAPIAKKVTNVNEIGNNSANGNLLFPYSSHYGLQVWLVQQFSLLPLANCQSAPEKKVLSQR